MLYDPKWEAKTDPMSLASLIAWLEAQPADNEYRYSDCVGCLLCHYLAYCGFSNVIVGTKRFYHGNESKRVNLPKFFDHISCAIPRTFGAALDRARVAARSKG